MLNVQLLSSDKKNMINRRKLHVVLDNVVTVSAFLTEGLTADLVAQSFDREADYV